jgi:hypothetical protein
MMVDSPGLPSNQWNASGSETSHASSNFATIPAMHGAHDAQDISFKDRIDQAESIRFSNNFKTLAEGFEPAEPRSAEYVTTRKKIIDDGPGHLSDQAINWIKATEDVQLEIIDAGLSESLKRAEKFAKICDLNESLAAKSRNRRLLSPSKAQTRSWQQLIMK